MIWNSQLQKTQSNIAIFLFSTCPWLQRFHSRPLHPKYLGFGFGRLSERRGLAYLRVRLRLLFKMLFVPKCIKMMFFFILKKLFLRPGHQNDPKYTKKINFSKKKMNFLGTRFAPRSQTATTLDSYFFVLLFFFSFLCVLCDWARLKYIGTT